MSVDPRKGTTGASFPQFSRLSCQLQLIIWDKAAEQAVAAFKLLHPTYSRVCSVVTKGPYVRFVVRDLTGTEAFFLNMLIMPLLKSTRSSRQCALQHVEMIFDRGRRPIPVFKNIDKFVLEGSTLESLINASELSDDALRQSVGMSNIAIYPGVLEERRQQHFALLSTAAHVAVPYFVFCQDRVIPYQDLGLCCINLLLRFPRLETVYVHLPCGILVEPPPSILYMRSGITTHFSFFSLGEVREGRFRPRFYEYSEFAVAYEHAWDLSFASFTKMFGPSSRGLVKTTSFVWGLYQIWEAYHMHEFVRCLDPFNAKGINCVLIQETPHEISPQITRTKQKVSASRKAALW
ncbi:hypothetical protein GGR52DRAFT_111954 [Hypoxylon sp. FL1284]|nr:hypothetical protein GGR52DRAFT_111954 [Hypoxylon sp. FL1284]